MRFAEVWACRIVAIGIGRIGGLRQRLSQLFRRRRTDILAPSGRNEAGGQQARKRRSLQQRSDHLAPPEFWRHRFMPGTPQAGVLTLESASRWELATMRGEYRAYP